MSQYKFEKRKGGDKWDYECDSIPPEKGGTTLCGKLGRKHRMKRWSPMRTSCTYNGCNGCC